MSGSGFVWVESPENIAKGFIDYGNKVEADLYAIAGKWGQDVQDAARQNAKWEDRTGNARSGIFYAVDGLGMDTILGEASAGAKALMSDTSVEQGSAKALIIIISHTVFYGKYLELSNGGQLAIIMTSIEENLPRLEQMVQQIFKG
jgi:hypothetical protein